MTSNKILKLELSSGKQFPYYTSAMPYGSSFLNSQKFGINSAF